MDKVKVASRLPWLGWVGHKSWGQYIMVTEFSWKLIGSEISWDNLISVAKVSMAISSLLVSPPGHHCSQWPLKLPVINIWVFVFNLVHNLSRLVRKSLNSGHGPLILYGLICHINRAMLMGRLFFLKFEAIALTLKTFEKTSVTFVLKNTSNDLFWCSRKRCVV